MKRTLAVTMVMVCVAAGGAFAQNQQQENQMEGEEMYVCPMHKEVKATWAAECPKCGMMLKKMDGDKDHWMNCAICLSNGNADELNLTEEQKKKLEELGEKNCDQVKDILTEEQMKKVEEMRSQYKEKHKEHQDQGIMDKTKKKIEEKSMEMRRTEQRKTEQEKK